MLEPTMRELMEEAGVRDVEIETDEKGIVGSGKFPGPEKQIRNRLAGDLDVVAMGMMDELTEVRCRPLS